MIWAIAVAVWITLVAGARLAMSRDVVRCAVGVSIIASAVNIVLFSSGRVDSALPAVVPAGEQALGVSSNPLPQALVLTAIVIGFALICFSLVLVLRLIHGAGSDNALDLRFSEPLPKGAIEPPVQEERFEPSWPPPIEPAADRHARGGREEARGP